MNAIAIAITIPQTQSWQSWLDEVAHAIMYDEIMNFKVGGFPTGIDKGSKCFVVHQGKVKGYQIICGFTEQEFQCTTTGKQWTGKFIQRLPKFYPLEREVDMKGFQNFRYVREEDMLGEEPSLFPEE